MRAIQLMFALIFLTSGALAQQPSPVAPTPAGSAASSADDSAKAHQNAVKLVELMGFRKKIEDNLDKMIETGKAGMAEKAPGTNPAFIEEWGKRFRTRFNAQEYVDFLVSVYEKHFTSDELVELIQIQLDANAGKTPEVSPKLKEKMTATMPTVMSEIMGGFTQLGSKLGAEVGQEIGKEHPDWVKDSMPANLPTEK